MHRLGGNLIPSMASSVMQQFAPLYSRRERVRLALTALAWAVPLMAATQWLFLPWLRGYAEQAHCQDYGAFNGIQALFYGVCVGLPLLFAVTLLIVTGSRSLRIIRTGHYPLPQEKVLRATAYRYGFRARLMGYIPLIFTAALLALSVHGFFVAKPIIELVTLDSRAPSCATP